MLSVTFDHAPDGLLVLDLSVAGVAAPVVTRGQFWLVRGGSSTQEADVNQDGKVVRQWHSLVAHLVQHHVCLTGPVVFGQNLIQ